METLLDFFLHLDTHLTQFVATYGAWVYGLLFADRVRRNRTGGHPVPAG